MEQKTRNLRKRILMKLDKSRTLESLTGCLTRLCTSDFFLIFYYFSSLRYSSHFSFIQAKITKLHLHRFTLNNYKFNYVNCSRASVTFKLIWKWIKLPINLFLLLYRSENSILRKHSFGTVQRVHWLVGENSVFRIERFSSI